MIVKKSGGRIFGASFTAAEQKALDMEIDRQMNEILAERTREYRDEIMARVLWVLRQEFNFSEKRLKQFAGAFDQSLDGLVQYYQMSEKDCSWLCQQKLKEAGIDFTGWDEKVQKVVPEILET